MDRERARAELASRADKLRSRGAAAVFIFGSTARGDARDDSDIDIFIDIEPGRKFSLIDLAGMHAFLRDELGIEIDLTTRESLHPKLRQRIENEALQVF